MDVAHQFGSDLQVGPSGDLQAVTGSSLTQQRVLKRLLTNAGDYIWQLRYGAGLAKFIGLPSDADTVRATIRSQIFKEASVARVPEPTIDIRTDGRGGVFVDILYTDAPSGQTEILSFAIDM